MVEGKLSAPEPQQKDETGPIPPEEPVLNSSSMEKPSTETNHRDPELQGTPKVMFQDPPPPSPQLHQSPAQLTQSPAQLTQSPAQLTQSPAQQTQSPAQQTQSPAQLTQSPAQLTQSPAQLTQSPAQLTQSPAQQTQSPAQLTQSPAQLTQSPAQLTQSPGQLTQSPAQLTQSPAQLTQSPARLTRSYSQSSVFPRSQILTEAHNINAAVLSSGVLCLPGTRDKGGRALVTVTTRNTIWLDPNCNSGELSLSLMSYPVCYRKEVRSLGLTVLVDCRRCSPVPALFKAFNLLQRFTEHSPTGCQTNKHGLRHDVNTARPPAIIYKQPFTLISISKLGEQPAPSHWEAGRTTSNISLGKLGEQPAPSHWEAGRTTSTISLGSWENNQHHLTGKLGEQRAPSHWEAGKTTSTISLGSWENNQHHLTGKLGKQPAPSHWDLVSPPNVQPVEDKMFFWWTGSMASFRVKTICL
ncbi:unnamed protein product, partial [Coregonus sp. 'balchen']